MTSARQLARLDVIEQCCGSCCTLVAASLVSATADSSATRWEAARLVSGFLGLDKQREAAAPPRGLQVIGGGFARTGHEVHGGGFTKARPQDL